MSKGDFTTLGASAHSKEEREENDFYATDPKALEIFLEQTGIELRNVTEEDIDTFEDPYFDMLDTYFEDDDDEILENFCDQPELAQFMAMEISTSDEDGTSLDDETATQLFIVTLAMISLMNRVIQI